MSALLFGSISSVADTSELQRRAFNEAFAQHGLSWTWEHDDYVAMLATSGGQDRVAAYAEAVGDDVDAELVHRTKSEIFQRLLASEPVTARAGVVDTIAAARAAGWKVALVTTTSADNVAALAAALRPAVDLDGFDLVVDRSLVAHPKPDRAVYDLALKRLGEEPGDCVAVEDNIGGVIAASAAGIPCVAFPNVNTADHSFDLATGRVERLDLEELRSQVGAA